MNPLLEKLIADEPALEAAVPQIMAAFELWKDSFAQGGKTLVCGNGGSAADSEHIVGELMKGFLLKRPLPWEEKERLQEAFGPQGTYLAAHLQGALPAISLASQTSLLTAFANDVAADLIFAQQVYGYGRPGDVLLAISTSGSSANVVHALRVAKLKEMKAIGLMGQGSGEMEDLCDAAIKVPYSSTPDIQQRHVAVYHTLCALLEQHFFGA